MSTVKIPTPLRPLAGGAAQVDVEGASVRDVLGALEARHPGFQARLMDGAGELRRFVNLYVNEEDVRHLRGLDTEVSERDVLSIVPAVAGGAVGEQVEQARPLSFAELREQVRARVREVEADAVRAALGGGDAPLLIDVREADEVAGGRLPGALHIPRGFLELKVEAEAPDRARPIVLYCAGGVRSLFAAESLERLGYRDVRSLVGGFRAWQTAGHPVERPRQLDAAERRRYARHLSIPEVGERGQVKLLESRVLLVGAGGLGCPAALYLAAAGVGTLGLVDFDVVDESNLQRQILHPTERVGRPKVDSARETLLGLNPGIDVRGVEERLTSENVERVLGDYDLVVDGSDNFPTRYLVNDACVRLKKPCVHGSVYRFEGQVTVFDPARGGPCYRCLYPEPPPPELAPSCADAGVLGVLPGVVGLLQAVEAIKLLLGQGDPLVGRLLCYDALAASFHALKLRPDPACRYCAPGAVFPGYVDYEAFCRAPAS